MKGLVIGRKGVRWDGRAHNDSVGVIDAYYLSTRYYYFDYFTIHIFTVVDSINIRMINRGTIYHFSKFLFSNSLI